MGESLIMQKVLVELQNISAQNSCKLGSASESLRENPGKSTLIKFL